MNQSTHLLGIFETDRHTCWACAERPRPKIYFAESSSRTNKLPVAQLKNSLLPLDELKQPTFCQEAKGISDSAANPERSTKALQKALPMFVTRA
jgi:hypothetical protein